MGNLQEPVKSDQIEASPAKYSTFSANPECREATLPLPANTKDKEWAQIIICIFMEGKGWSPEKKVAVLLDFVQITLTPLPPSP